MAGDKITALNGGVKHTAIADDDILPITDVSEAGTGTTKPIERGELLKDIVDLNLNEATELTIDGAGAITLTQAVHKLQPNAGVADDLDDINGMTAGSLAALYVTDEGVDTITVKHGTGNISCLGDHDVTISEGGIFVYYDGAVVYVLSFHMPVLDEDAMGSDSDVSLATQQSIKKYVDDNAGGGGIGQNFLINGSFRVAQRGTTFDATTTPLNSDDTYLLDRWLLLSDGNDVVDVSQSTTVIPDGIKASIKLEVETANKQFGILQILENEDAMAFAGKKASLTFQARMAAADDNTHSLKAIVLAWDGAADTVTSDVVNAWLATPTYVANWTGENTPASNTLTTSWQTFTIENISIDTASMANLAVFIFCDQTDGAVDDVVYITGVKLEVGESATDFVPRLYQDEYDMCLRFYEHSASDVKEVRTVVAFTTAIIQGFYYIVPKRAVPTVTIYSRNGTVSKVSLTTTGGDIGNAATAEDISAIAFHRIRDAGSPYTVGLIYEAGYIVDAEL